MSIITARLIEKHFVQQTVLNYRFTQHDMSELKIRYFLNELKNFLESVSKTKIFKIDTSGQYLHTLGNSNQVYKKDIQVSTTDDLEFFETLDAPILGLDQLIARLSSHFYNMRWYSILYPESYRTNCSHQFKEFSKALEINDLEIAKQTILLIDFSKIYQSEKYDPGIFQTILIKMTKIGVLGAPYNHYKNIYDLLIPILAEKNMMTYEAWRAILASSFYKVDLNLIDLLIEKIPNESNKKLLSLIKEEQNILGHIMTPSRVYQSNLFTIPLYQELNNTQIYQTELNNYDKQFSERLETFLGKIQIS